MEEEEEEDETRSDRRRNVYLLAESDQMMMELNGTTHLTHITDDVIYDDVLCRDDN